MPMEKKAEEKEEEFKNITKWTRGSIHGIKVTLEELEEHFRKDKKAFNAARNTYLLSKHPVDPKLIESLLNLIRLNLPKDFIEEPSQKE